MLQTVSFAGYAKSDTIVCDSTFGSLFKGIVFDLSDLRKERTV